jgi:4-amino-4-deoxychorismate lyase
VSVLVNGEFCDHIPVSDRGLHYGDGLFETLAVVNGFPRLWDRHMARLGRGEEALGLPLTDKQLLRLEADRLCRESDRGVLKIILTRGSGGRGYRPPANPDPRRIIAFHPWPDYPESWFTDGMRIRLCKTRWSSNKRLAGVKHLNRLDQVLARNEWHDTGIAEGVMCDEQDRVISATQGNLFLVSDGRLLTPELDHAGIAGVMREVVILSAQSLGIPVEITDIPLEYLYRADALFVTNAILGICPVGRFDEQVYLPGLIPPRLLQKVGEELHLESRHKDPLP